MATWQPTTLLAKVVHLAGFAYDPEQDIIYSRMDALQRYLGYGYGYDLAAIFGAANVDCEPIFFEYGGKRWMVEPWKGQYGLETGCEIGVYNRPPQPPSYYRWLDAVIGWRPVDPDPAHGLFFQCVADDEMPQLSFTLLRNGVPLLHRPLQPHWWLTGFKWGVYSTPADLAMDITMVFPNDDMRQAFVRALEGMGYAPNVDALTVEFRFAAPRAPQPPKPPAVSRTIQAWDEAVVETYAGLRLPNNDPNQIPLSALRDLVVGVVKRIAAFVQHKLGGAGEPAPTSN